MAIRGGAGSSPLRPLQQRQRSDESKSSTGTGSIARGPGGARKGKRKGKADGSLGIGVGRYTGVGFDEVDEWEEDDEQRRHKRSVLALLDEDEPLLLNEDDLDQPFEPLSTVAPEFRPHVVARMTEARSLCSGSTMPKKKKKKKKKTPAST